MGKLSSVDFLCRGKVWCATKALALYLLEVVCSYLLLLPIVAPPSTGVGRGALFFSVTKNTKKGPLGETGDLG